MLLNISEAKQNEGKALHFNIDVELDSNIIADKGYSFESNISVDGEMEYDCEILTIKGKATYPIRFVCDRCGEPYIRKVVVDFVENFSNTGNVEHYPLTTNLDLTKPLIHNLMYDIPTRNLCKPNCKGLCKICGRNLNKGTCNCCSLEIDDNNPFKKLKNKLK